jgi:sarcosine oxidase subunit beta
MMAELIEQSENGRDHDKDPVVFRLNHLKKGIGLNFFSRRREINTDSSFSVLG